MNLFSPTFLIFRFPLSFPLRDSGEGGVLLSNQLQMVNTGINIKPF